MIEKGKIIELENNDEYYIIDKIKLKGRCYLYISKLNPINGHDLCFVEYIDDKIFPVSNDSILTELLLLISKQEIKRNS